MRIDIRSLSVRLGRTAVLRDVEFAAEPGRVTALLGPNGSGKTTLLRSIAGLVDYTGQVLFDGREKTDRHRVGYMAQDMALRPVLSVLEVVMLGRLGRLGWRVADEDIARAAGAIAAVGMDAFASRDFGELSGGQRQLVQFAQVLAREPSVALLDEPTSALDLRHQFDLLDLVRRETTARAMTTVVSLHDLNLALHFADQVVVLKDGIVHAAGPPVEVLGPGLVAEVYGVEIRQGRLDDGRPTLTTVRALPK